MRKHVEGNNVRAAIEHGDRIAPRPTQGVRRAGSLTTRQSLTSSNRLHRTITSIYFMTTPKPRDHTRAVNHEPYILKIRHEKHPEPLVM